MFAGNKTGPYKTVGKVKQVFFNCMFDSQFEPAVMIAYIRNEPVAKDSCSTPKMTVTGSPFNDVNSVKCYHSKSEIGLCCRYDKYHCKTNTTMFTSFVVIKQTKLCIFISASLLAELAYVASIFILLLACTGQHKVVI